MGGCYSLGLSLAFWKHLRYLHLYPLGSIPMEVAGLPLRLFLCHSGDGLGHRPPPPGGQEAQVSVVLWLYPPGLT